MKKFYILLALLLMFPVATYGAPTDKLSFQGEPGNTCNQTVGADNFRIDSCGRLIEAANETTMGMVSLPLTSFTREGGEITQSPEGTGPESPNETVITAADGNPVLRLQETTEWIESSFRVPDNYYQNGDFRIKLTSNENTHVAALDFTVRVHTDTALDTTDSIETAVALAASPGETTVEELELDPESKFASLAAGNWVTIKVRRDAKYGTYQNDVDIYNFVFRYEKLY